MPRKNKILVFLFFAVSALFLWRESFFVNFQISHEEDIFISAVKGVGELRSAGIITDNVRIPGGFYYFVLKASGFLHENLVQGSVYLLVLHAFAQLGLAFALFGLLRTPFSLQLFLGIVWLLSPLFLMNYRSLWSISFLPFYVTLGMITLHLSMVRRDGVGAGARLTLLFAFLTLAAFTCHIHQSSLVIPVSLFTLFFYPRAAKLPFGWPARVAALAYFLALYGFFSVSSAPSASSPHLTVALDMVSRIFNGYRFSAVWNSAELAAFAVKTLWEIPVILLYLFFFSNLRALWNEANPFAAFLVRMALLSSPLAIYAWMHFFTNLVFFRERYLILPFLSLLFLAAAKPRLFLRVRWRIFPALSVALLALWLFLIPGAVDIKSVLLVVGFAGAAFFLRSPKLSLLLLVAALGHIAYFSAAERVQKQEMGERLTLARANALVGWLREQTGYRWDELAPKLIFTDSYVLNALGGLYENFSVEAFSRRLENPEIGRDGYLISSHDFWKAYSGEACEVVFHALLARHAPLADFNGRGLLERVSCHEVGGQWVVKFFWAEGSGIVSWGNYGWNVSTLLEDLLPTPSLLANSSFLELSIPAASSRVYRSEVAHYGGLKLLMSCGESQVKEINLLPGAESRFSFLPQPWRRNTNHLLTAPVVVSASPCPNFSGKAVWATEIRAKDFKQTERLGGNEVSTLGRN